MTVQEAIKILHPESSFEALLGYTREEGLKIVEEACVLACEALEKQIPKKLIDISKTRDNEGYIGLIGKCPCCDEILEEDTVCCDCGQKLDWGDE